MSLGDIGNDGSQGANAQWVMLRSSNVMLFRFGTSQPDMTAVFLVDE